MYRTRFRGRTIACLAVLCLVAAGLRATGARADDKALPTTSPGAVPGPPGFPRVASITSGHLFDCLLGTDGSVWCWGFNANGQLGDGTTDSRQIPARVPIPARVTELSAFYATVCALTEDGAVWCWGDNNTGQVGHGTRTDRASPERVPGLDRIAHLGQGGTSHFCVVATDAGAWCWGENTYGQLGTGDEATRSGPVRVSVVDSRISSIVQASSHTCAVVGSLGESSDGVRCWGFGFDGELGDGILHSSVLAVAPVGLETNARVRQLETGYQHTCALQDGSVLCWGVNESGGLGLGDRENRAAPTRLDGLPRGAISLAITDIASSSASCAVYADGSAWCWGSNASGELGDGSTAARLAPARILADGVEMLSSGGDHGLALRRDGSLVRWGNGSGTLEELRFAPGPGGGRSANTGAVPFRSPGPLTPTITTTIPTPADISTDPPVVGANLLLAALAMLAFTIATELLNRTLVELEPLLLRWVALVARVRRARKRAGTSIEGRLHRTRHANAIRLLLIAAFYGLVFSFLDPTWNPLSPVGAWLVVSFAVACGLVGMAGDFMAWGRARRWGAATRVSLRPGNLLAAAGSTLATRGLALIPGVMVGVPSGIEIEEERLPAAERARLPLLALAAVVGVGLLAWATTASTARLPRDLPILGPLGGGLEAFLLLVFSVALQNSFVMLLAFRGSAGEALLHRSRIAWAAALLAVSFVFLHTLVNPRGDLARALGSTNVQAFLATIGVIVVAAALAWGAGSLRRRRARSLPPAAPGPVFPPPPVINV